MGGVGVDVAARRPRRTSSKSSDLKATESSAGGKGFVCRHDVLSREIQIETAAWPAVAAVTRPLPSFIEELFDRPP
jgi:hypothetical protein